MNKFLSFDIEIAKEIPEGETDWKAHRPLGTQYVAKEKEYLEKAETCKPKQRGAYLSHAAQAAKNAERMRKNLEYQLAWLREQGNRKGKEVYKKIVKCAICDGPVEIESPIPFGPDDDIGVICDDCAEAEPGPQFHE